MTNPIETLAARLPEPQDVVSEFETRIRRTRRRLDAALEYARNGYRASLTRLDAALRELESAFWNRNTPREGQLICIQALALIAHQDF